VNGKVFVFLGVDPVPGGSMGLSVKLPLSGEEALDLPFAKPTGYGLGKSGWVNANFGPDDHPPVEILKAWILESYRAIAPKKLAELVPARFEKRASHCARWTARPRKGPLLFVAAADFRGRSEVASVIVWLLRPVRRPIPANN